MIIELTDKQLKSLLKDKEFRSEIVNRQAGLIHENIISELGCYVGRRFTFPISLASRLSGFNEKWIRRNLPIISTEGHADVVEFGDIISAMNERKSK